ncbi:MAG: ABC transporter permease [Acidobacteriaceae bacterium]
MQTLAQDLRYALRQLRLSPIFATTAIVTLALGIGATTAIFSLVHSIMLRSLPVADPASLYRIGDSDECCVESGLQDDWSIFSYALYQRFQQAAPEFEQLAAFQGGGGGLGVRRADSHEPAKPLRGEFVSGNYFSMFGVNAFAGRTLTPSDDRPSAAPAAVLSYREWQQSYASDPKVLGATFILEGHSFTIVGIAPPGFYGDTLRSDPPALWLPLQQEPMVMGDNSRLNLPATNWLRIIGRLKPGASSSTLPARFTTIIRQWIPESGMTTDPEQSARIRKRLPQQHVEVVPAGGGVAIMKREYHDSLRLLMIICAVVLLIACANIANLLLARGAVRRQQTSVQLALGISRRRLVRQALTESVLLAGLGGLAGIAVAYAGTRLVLALAFHSAHFVPIHATPSLPVLAFAFILSLLTGVLFGTAPAWLATHADPAEALRGANRSTRDSSSLPQKALVIVQATLSVVLLASAGMLTHSLRNMEHRDFGFAPQNRVAVELQPPPASYTPERLAALYRAAIERLDRIPGVERAAFVMYNPLSGDNWGEGVAVEGKPQTEDSDASWERVSAGFFETVGEPILRGRGITEQDNANTRPIAVVNEAFAKKFFPNEDPLGKHFGMDLPAYAGTYEIVGVVRDAKYTDPQGKTRSMFFVPLAQTAPYKGSIERVETESHFMRGAMLLYHGETGSLEPQLRRALGEVDANLAIISVQPFPELIAINFDQQRAVAQLAGLFGILALILAAVGLYGVTAYTVARRTNEIGVRMALGANRTNVIRLVLRGAFLQIAIGLAIGIPLAIAAGRLLGSQLYQVSSWDPAALATAIALLALCALLASIIPAQRAASVDPVKTLRTE